MYTPGDHIKKVFETASSSYRELADGNKELLHALNREVLEWNIGGRAVVLALAEEELDPVSNLLTDSHIFPQGRLSGFDVLLDEDEDPELVAVLHDLRGDHVSIEQVALTGHEVPFDTGTELRGDPLFCNIQEVMSPGNLDLWKLIGLVKEIPADNLSLAIFAAGMNDLALPQELVSTIHTSGHRVVYFNGYSGFCLDVTPIIHSVNTTDMFRLSSPLKNPHVTPLISSMTPTDWEGSFRTIYMDEYMEGYDLA